MRDMIQFRYISSDWLLCHWHALAAYCMRPYMAWRSRRLLCEKNSYSCGVGQLREFFGDDQSTYRRLTTFATELCQFKSIFVDLLNGTILIF